VTRGVQIVEQHGAQWRADVGAVIAIPPDVVHSNFSLNPRGWAYSMFYPTAHLIDRLITGGERQVSIGTFDRPVVTSDALGARLRRLIATLDADETQLAKETELVSALAHISKTTGGLKATLNAKAIPRGVKRARDHLLEHFVSECSLQSLAEIAACSPYHLASEFSKTFGIGPHGFQIQLRVQMAKAILRNGASVADAAAECGFFDQSHLNRHFKKIVGVPPNDYRIGGTSH
jgi:AraC-like DNA-binding protein